MKRFPFVLLLIVLVFVPHTVKAQTSDSGVDADAIIRRFTEKEKAAYEKFKNHSFKRDVVYQVIGAGGQVAGEYRRNSRFVSDSIGTHHEKVIDAPISRIGVTKEDFQDFGTIQTFGVEPWRLDAYKFTYVGKERIDEIDAYVFDVTPKVMLDPKQAKKNKERFFQGRIYIDTIDHQLVKARGKGVPEGKQRYPTFETYRQPVGDFWLPSYTYADDELVHANGRTSHVRMRIKFTDYEPGAKD